MRFRTLLPLLASSAFLNAQDAPPKSLPVSSVPKADDTAPLAPQDLPGKGLSQHSFFYAGENSALEMYIVREGKVVWTYHHPAAKGEISDAELLPNGDVLFAHQFGVTEISADKKIVWNHDAPAGCEIHTAQAIGKDRVWFIQNGNPAMFFVINKTTNEIEKQFALPVKNPASVHGHFRHARLTAEGTLLVAHMDMGKVAEYDSTGKEIWSYATPTPWAVEPLRNGNILVTAPHQTVREVNRKGETVWEFTGTDIPGYTLAQIQTAVRLQNGNTLMNNWTRKKNGTPVQVFEVTSDKKVVWALRSWEGPDALNSSTIIQVLDDESPSASSRHFGDIR